MNTLKTALLITILLNGFEYSKQGSDETKLHEYLFSTPANGTAYNPKIRPIKDATQRIKVSVTIGLKRLFEMDEINHRVTIFAILVKTWQDEFLKWDPKDFNNIEYTYVNYNQIWTPQLQLVSRFFTDDSNGASDNGIQNIYDNYPVKLCYNGSVQFTPQLHLTTECLLDYSHFPFDQQTCSFRFQAPYNLRQIDMSFVSYYTKEYQKYDQIWKIDDVKWASTTIQERYPVNFLRIDFKRVVRNYLFTMPSYIVYMLTLLMFVLPQTSNQRILIGSTCLIIATMLAYSMAINLPHTDIAAWPILGKMYLFNIVLLAFSLIFSAFIINISNHDHIKSVPDWLRKLTLNILAKIFCIQAIAYTVFNSYSFNSRECSFEEQETSKHHMLLHMN